MNRLEKTADAMGATWSIVLYGQDRKRMDQAVAEAFSEIRRLDEMLSIYKPDSEWSAINRSAATTHVRVSQESLSLLFRCRDYSARTEGAFDITVGALLRTWGFLGGSARRPDDSEIANALARTGYRHLLLNSEAYTVRFDQPGLEIDPGGIGKGYAVDRAAEVLRGHGFDTALLTASSSTIYGMGSPPSEPKGWPVDIRDPVNPKKAIETVFLRDMSISTSGVLEQSFWSRGVFYGHIIDPRTGYPASGVVSASVVAPHATDSEAWTKPCLINGQTWVESRKPEDFSVFLCVEGRGLIRLGRSS